MGVVGDDAESCVSRVLLHDSSKSHLRRRCHCVGFVEDDEFEGSQGRRSGSRNGREDLFCAAKGLDLLSDDFDASVVTRIEFEHHLAHVLVAVYSAGEREDCRRLAGAWGSVKEKMG